MSKKNKGNRKGGVKRDGSHSYSVGKKAPTVKSDEYHGIGTAFDKGYITFCLKKKNALGKKCNRKHLLPTGFNGNGQAKSIPANPSFKNQKGKLKHDNKWNKNGQGQNYVSTGIR